MAENQMMKIPYFSKGLAASLTKALAPGGKFENLDKALFYFAIDTKQWILVDVDKSVHVINGQKEPVPPSTGGGVIRVDELPSVLDADPENLYILGDTIYSFNGIEFVSATQRVEDLIGNVPHGATVIEYIDDVRDDTVEMARNYISSILDITVLYDD